MLGGRKYFVSSAYEQKWVNDTIFNSKDIRLAVCDAKTEKYIGNVYLTDINYVNRTAESHILIGEKEFWGKGIASEAYLLLLDYAFNEIGLNRIEARVLESNFAIALSIKANEGDVGRIYGKKDNYVYIGEMGTSTIRSMP